MNTFRCIGWACGSRLVKPSRPGYQVCHFTILHRQAHMLFITKESRSVHTGTCEWTGTICDREILHESEGVRDCGPRPSQPQSILGQAVVARAWFVNDKRTRIRHVSQGNCAVPWPSLRPVPYKLKPINRHPLSTTCSSPLTEIMAEKHFKYVIIGGGVAAVSLWSPFPCSSLFFTLLFQFGSVEFPRSFWSGWE